MTQHDDTAPRSDGGHGRHPTPQGPKAAGPGNAHGVQPDDAPDDSNQQERPFDPDGGRPAADPDATAERVLKQAERGPKTEGDAGPLGVAGRDEA
jgi:hypothetical protein